MRRMPPKAYTRSFRHTVKIPCQVVRERDFRLVSDCTCDLSESGALVGPADPTLTGERVIVSFQLPTCNTWVDSEATVTRVVHGRRSGEHKRALALHFDTLSTPIKGALGRFLKNKPFVPPGHRPGRRSTRFALWHRFN